MLKKDLGLLIFIVLVGAIVAFINPRLLLPINLSNTMNLIGLYGIFSIGVGFVNLLPLPILDGGHLVFYLIQSVTQKPVSGRIQTAAFPIAIALIVGLMLFAGWNDINHTGLAQYIGRLFS